jgi:hypothetical protein
VREPFDLFWKQGDPQSATKLITAGSRSASCRILRVEPGYELSDMPTRNIGSRSLRSILAFFKVLVDSLERPDLASATKDGARNQLLKSLNVIVMR